MRYLITVLLSLLSIVGVAQNQGINPENSVLKLDYIAFFEDVHIFRLTNKQSCSVTVQYRIMHTGVTRDTVIPALASVAINVPGDEWEDEHLRARATQICQGNTGDQGWIEQHSQGGIVLPIKFEYLRAQIIDKNTIWVYFKVLEASGEKSFNIQIAPDGKTFRTVAVVLADTIVSNKEYSKKIKL